MKHQTTTTKPARKPAPNENPFAVGQAAGEAGHNIKSCPYLYGSTTWARWLSGWNWATSKNRKAAA